MHVYVIFIEYTHEIANVLYSLQYTELLYILFISVYILRYSIVSFRNVCLLS